ncbi:MAG: type II toxin-antitoxin system death-on-curing family toxin [Candidatus Sumerlaeia bacterium]
MKPRFLSLSEVLEIHQDQIARYGGHPGIRDLDLLQSALAMPSAEFGGQFLHASLHEMASAYLFHIVRSHPFIDGNKRVGAVASLVFLELNGIELTAPENDFANMVISVAAGKLDKAGVAVRLKRWMDRS